MRGVYVQKRSPFYWVRYYDKYEPDETKRRKSFCSKIEISNSDLKRIEDAKEKGVRVKLIGTPEIRTFSDAFRRGLAENDAEMKSGIPLKRQILFSDGLEKYLQERTLPGRKGEIKAKTVEQYRDAAKHFLAACGDKPVNKYTESDYFKLLKYLESYKWKRKKSTGEIEADGKKKKETTEHPLSANSRSIYTRALRALWSYFVSKKMTPVNIIEATPEDLKEPDPIPLPSVAVILTKLQENTDYPQQYQIILFMLLTGCRPSTAVMQLREDINFDSGLIKMNNIKTGKRKGKPYYYFPIYPALRELLKDTMQVKAEESGRLFPAYAESALSYVGSMKFWPRLMAELVGKEMIPRKFMLKQIRPTTASFLVNGLRMDPYDVMKLLDHTDIKVTLQHYVQQKMEGVQEDLQGVSMSAFLKILNNDNSKG